MPRFNQKNKATHYGNYLLEKNTFVGFELPEKH